MNLCWILLSCAVTQVISCKFTVVNDWSMLINNISRLPIFKGLLTLLMNPLEKCAILKFNGHPVHASCYFFFVDSQTFERMSDFDDTVKSSPEVFLRFSELL